MTRKNLNSKFYNCSYYRPVHISKAPDNKLVACSVYGDIQKEFVKELKDNFGFQPTYSDIDFPGVRFSVSGAIEKKNLGKMKEYLKEKGAQVQYDRYVYIHFEIPGGYLYSGWKTGRKTKIKPEDLPESYVYLSNYKKEGYLETAGVVDVVYQPSVFHNHSFKDDFLYLSYEKQLPGLYAGYSDEVLKACDEYVFGNDIVDVVAGIEKNNPDNPELQKKIQVIKAQMVKQYN